MQEYLLKKKNKKKNRTTEKQIKPLNAEKNHAHLKT